MELETQNVMPTSNTLPTNIEKIKTVFSNIYVLQKEILRGGIPGADSWRAALGPRVPASTLKGVNIIFPKETTPSA